MLLRLYLISKVGTFKRSIYGNGHPLDVITKPMQSE